jgi:hypothetical protein
LVGADFSRFAGGIEKVLIYRHFPRRTKLARFLRCNKASYPLTGVQGRAPPGKAANQDIAPPRGKARETWSAAFLMSQRSEEPQRP